MKLINDRDGSSNYHKVVMIRVILEFRKVFLKFDSSH